MSNNLNLTQVAENQAHAEVPINDKGGELDAALTETVSINLTDNVSVSAADYRRAIRLLVTTAGASKTLTLPAIKRLIIIENRGGANFTIVRGATTIPLENATSVIAYTDGSADGLVSVGGGGATVAPPFDLGIFMPGTPVSGATTLRFTAVRQFLLPINLTDSRATAGVAATAEATFSLQKNGIAIGTVAFSADASLGTFTFASATTFDPGDVLSITAPAPQDATLADVAFNLKGTR